MLKAGLLSFRINKRKHFIKNNTTLMWAICMKFSKIPKIFTLSPSNLTKASFSIWSQISDNYQRMMLEIYSEYDSFNLINYSKSQRQWAIVTPTISATEIWNPKIFCCRLRKMTVQSKSLISVWAAYIWKKTKDLISVLKLEAFFI